MRDKYNVFLVQQGTLSMLQESVPLASAYIKSFCLQSNTISQNFKIDIKNFLGSVDAISMSASLFSSDVPDILAFSTCCWNFKNFIEVSKIYKQLNPNGLIVMGGPHVSNQSILLNKYSEIDIIVNGEGEEIFRDILLCFNSKKEKQEYDSITGIITRTVNGDIKNMGNREQIDVNLIPSPYLDGTINLFTGNSFRYDVALMETNRGCPYNCAYCNWGGATHTKYRWFSLDRLKQELEFLARNKVENVVLLDSNFGESEHDEQFLDLLILAKNKYGFPKHLETSWTKSKSDIFMRIIKKLKKNNFTCSFTIAVQTLNKEALQNINRTNFSLDNSKNYIFWLNKNGYECYGELIWGIPGETYNSFIEGYDELSNYLEKIAIYSLMLIPNTKFYESKQEFGIVSAKNADNDCEYVFFNNSITLEENKKMYSFIFLARLLSENIFFNSIWLPLKKLGNIKQSVIINSFDKWCSKQSSHFIGILNRYKQNCCENVNVYEIHSPLVLIYENAESLHEEIKSWWESFYKEHIKVELWDFFEELMDYDFLTKPFLEKDKYMGQEYIVKNNVKLNYNFPEILRDLKNGLQPRITKQSICCNIKYKTGFENYIDCQEFASYYYGETFNVEILNHENEIHPLQSSFKSN